MLRKVSFLSFHPSNLKLVFSWHNLAFILLHQLPTFLLSPADSSLLISDFEPQQASAEAGTEDEFDPIPVTGRKNSQGESLHSPQGSTGGSSWSSGLKTHGFACLLGSLQLHADLLNN